MTGADGAEQSSHRGSNLPGLAVLAGLAVLLLVAVGWGWTAHRRVADAEAAAAAATADRESAVKALGEREAAFAEAQASTNASTAKIAELEQQVQSLDGMLAGANADLARLRSELSTQTATANAAPAPAAAAPVGPQALGSVEPAAAPPAPEPVAKPERLTITFDVNSSFLPSSLGGRLRALAEQLAADRSYAVRLVGSVGNGDVAGKPAEEAQRYNRWIAERRVDRVAGFLQRTAKARDLKIAREFAANDPSRQVLVEVTPVTD
jgi:outer membrane protein OmpA-like peptidoglycan-associated protein